VVKTMKRTALRVAGAVGALGVTAVLLPGAAEAATPSTLLVCSDGPFHSYVALPDRGGLTTRVVQSGQCTAFSLGGSSNERADVWGTTQFSGPDGSTGGGGPSYYIGSFVYNGTQGANIATVDGPSFYSF
jgi:hypothetical protein